MRLPSLPTMQRQVCRFTIRQPRLHLPAIEAYVIDATLHAVAFALRFFLHATLHITLFRRYDYDALFRHTPILYFIMRHTTYAATYRRGQIFTSATYAYDIC